MRPTYDCCIKCKPPKRHYEPVNCHCKEECAEWAEADRRVQEDKEKELKQRKIDYDYNVALSGSFERMTSIRCKKKGRYRDG